MGIAVSLVLIALGAVLVWATDADAAGLELDVVGWILLALGAVGAALSLVVWVAQGWRSPRRVERPTTGDR